MDVEAIMDELEDHGFDDASSERMLAVINDAYWDVCAREPWPFLEASTTLHFDDDTSGTSDEWPTDFRAATAMVVTAGGNVGTKLQYLRSDDFLQKFASNLTQTGNPRYFYTIGGAWYFYPIPTADIQITMYYVKQPTALDANSVATDIVIPLSFHRAVLVNGALFKLYAMEDDTDIAPTFETYFERGIANMREFCWRQQYIQNDIIHPVDNDDLGLDYFGWGSDTDIGS